jgi:hypothetical protein
MLLVVLAAWVLGASASPALELNAATSHRRFLLGQRFFEQKSSAGACWREAVAASNATCAEVLQMGPAKQVLALAFTNCHLLDSLRPRVPCAAAAAAAGNGGRAGNVASCTARMSDAEFALYTAFFTHTDNLCFFLQSELWQQATELTIAALSREAAGAAELMGAASRELGGVLSAQHALFALLANLRSLAGLCATLLAVWAAAAALVWGGVAGGDAARGWRVFAQVLLVANAGLDWLARELLLPHAAALGGPGAAAEHAVRLATACRCALPVMAVAPLAVAAAAKAKAKAEAKAEAGAKANVGDDAREPAPLAQPTLPTSTPTPTPPTPPPKPRPKRRAGRAGSKSPRRASRGRLAGSTSKGSTKCDEH